MLRFNFELPPVQQHVESVLSSFPYLLLNHKSLCEHLSLIHISLEIQSGTFTLDLNGHQLAPDEGTATVTVGKRAALTLTDGVGGGKLVGAKKKAAGSAMAGVGVSVEGSLTVTGGKPFTIQGGGSNLITGESAIALKTGSSLQVSGTGAIRVQGGDGLGTNRGASAIDAKNAVSYTHLNGRNAARQIIQGS